MNDRRPQPETLEPREETLGWRSQPTGSQILLLVLLLLAPLRLIELEADSPAGLTASGAPLSDEGAYSSGAFRHYTTGDWSLEGAHNPAVVTPVYTLFQRASFELFGPSFFSVRVIGVVSFGLLLVCACYLMASQFGFYWAGLLGLCLSVQPVVLAYSRSALLELPSLALVLAAAAVLVAFRSSVPAVFVAGVLFAAGVLVKLNALFGGLGLVWLIIMPWRPKSLLLKLPALAAGFALPIAGYVWIVVENFAEEWSACWQIFQSYSGTQTLWNLVISAYSLLREVAALDAVLVLMMVSAGVLVLLRPRKFVNERLTVFFLLLLGPHTASIVSHPYRATRYLVVLVVVGTCFAFFVAAATWLRGGVLKRFIAPLLAAMLLINGIATVSQLMALDSSYVSASRQIDELLEPGAVLMGDIADQIALEADVVALHGEHGVLSFDERLQLFDPDYFVHSGPLEPKQIAALSARFEISLLAKFDVMDNYYSGEPLHLFRLSDRTTAVSHPAPDSLDP